MFAASALADFIANAILPGLMNTPMAIESRVGLDGKSRDQVIAERDARVPLGRKMGTAWDIARVAWRGERVRSCKCWWWTKGSGRRMGRAATGW